MSPTEHDLRNALHHGEGDGLDADRLIAGGQARRQQRRVRIGSSVAAAAFVAVAATGASLLLGNDNHQGSDTAGGANKRADSQGAASASAGGGRLAPAPESAASAAVHCPPSLPRQLLPGGGSPGQFGSGGKLFAQPVSSVVVCAYGTKQEALDNTPPPLPGRLVVSGAQAQQLLVSLEGAPKIQNTVCPTAQPASVRDYALIGVAVGGGMLRTVTLSLAEPACQSMITNGTAIRYAWQPPAGLDTVLNQLRPTTGPLRGRVGSSPS